MISKTYQLKLRRASSLRSNFKNIENILPVNFATNRGLPKLLEEIKLHINRLPHIGDALPKKWVLLRKALEKSDKNYMSFDEYQSICNQNGFLNPDEQSQLLRYLNDIGVCLHFRNDLILSNTIFLKPTWATLAVYAILTNDDIRFETFGKFDHFTLDKIWKNVEYSEKRLELLQLMLKFRLCYKIPNTESTYIAPQLLPNEQPSYNHIFEENFNKSVVFRYSYDFMPKGIISRFIVVMHHWIEEQRFVWRRGVLLNYEMKNHTWAEITEVNQSYHGQINIRIIGKNCFQFLSYLTHEIRQFKSEVQQVLMSADKILRKAFDSQEIFWVCD